MYEEHKADISEVPATNLSGRHHGRERFDVAALRRTHPIETVVAASGVELTQRGQGFMGYCPFHEDSTASLSVGGIPERFHCFGCGAGGDVIEHVARFTGGVLRRRGASPGVRHDVPRRAAGQDGPGPSAGSSRPLSERFQPATAQSNCCTLLLYFAPRRHKGPRPGSGEGL